MDQAIRIGIAVAAGGLLICGSILSFRGMAAEAVATYGAAILGLIFAFLARFKRFKGLGIEAELWEEKQEEAAELVDKLRTISGAIADPLVAMSSRVGRFDSAFSRREHFDFMNRLEAALLKAGVDPASIENMKSPWHKYNALDLARPIHTALNEEITSKIQGLNRTIMDIPKPLDPEQQVLQKKLIAQTEELQAATRDLAGIMERLVDGDQAEVPQKLSDWIEQIPHFDAEERKKLRERLQDMLEDLRHYISHHRFRRPEVWFAGDGY